VLTNYLQTDAHYRREIPLTFPNQFAEQEEKTIDGHVLVYKADPELLNKIVNDEEEMSGIFNLLMNSLEIIDEHKEIYVKTTISERRAKAELIKDPVSAFVDKCCVPSSDTHTLKDEVYQKFVKFCNTNTLQIPSYDSLAKDLGTKKHGFMKDRIRVKGYKEKQTVWYIKVFDEDEMKKEDEELEEKEEKEEKE
jgi:Poxvirus D5 protein-like